MLWTVRFWLFSFDFKLKNFSQQISVFIVLILFFCRRLTTEDSEEETVEEKLEEDPVRMPVHH